MIALSATSLPGPAAQEVASKSAIATQSFFMSRPYVLGDGCVLGLALFALLDRLVVRFGERLGPFGIAGGDQGLVVRLDPSMVHAATDSEDERGRTDKPGPARHFAHEGFGGEQGRDHLKCPPRGNSTRCLIVIVGFASANSRLTIRPDMALRYIHRGLNRALIFCQISMSIISPFRSRRLERRRITVCRP